MKICGWVGNLLVGAVMLCAASVWAGEQTTLFPSPLKANARWIDVKQNALRFERKGLAAMAVEDYPTAIQAFQLGIALNPDSTLAASLYHNLGLSFRASRDYPRAIRAAQSAVALHPGYEMYRFHLVRTYEAAGLLEAAQAELERLQAFNPANDQVASLLATVKERRQAVEKTP